MMSVLGFSKNILVSCQIHTSENSFGSYMTPSAWFANIYIQKVWQAQIIISLNKEKISVISHFGGKTTHLELKLEVGALNAVGHV